MIPQKIKTTVLVYSSAQTGLKIVFNEPIILVIIQVHVLQLSVHTVESFEMS